MSSDVTNPRRKLGKDIDVTTMYNMRAEGMTNKQIAFALGVHPNTIYKYIGRMSEAVKHAEVQNKPPVVPEMKIVQPESDKKPQEKSLIEKARKENAEKRKEEVVEKKVENEMPIAQIKPQPKSTLRVISQRVSLEGNICKYVVDSESNSLEITDGTVTGLLDRETLTAFISELIEIAPMIGAVIRA